jgi:hypothetical protein
MCTPEAAFCLSARQRCRPAAGPSVPTVRGELEVAATCGFIGLSESESESESEPEPELGPHLSLDSDLTLDRI